MFKTLLLVILFCCYVRGASVSKGTCRPIPASLTSPKTGQKAWDKCVEYQERLIYPCEKGAALTGALSRGNHCKHNADELIVGGTAAAKYEFPHMVLLGSGEESNIEWHCGGALISERYILTAGHCISNKAHHNVSYAQIGALLRTEVTDLTKRYKVQKIIKHPKYSPPQKYHDIALLETERPVTLDEFTVPACLHVGDQIDDTKASATGWGQTENTSTSDKLLKVILTKFTHEDCLYEYRDYRLLRAGVHPGRQICYGDQKVSRDTCLGDSGGPLQIKSKKINCMYVIIGVTSFGSGCGTAGVPGVYTKVASYLPWIESIVWP